MNERVAFAWIAGVGIVFRPETTTGNCRALAFLSGL